MNRIQRLAIITRLMDCLDEKGSWCGETHIQKAAYFLQELLRVPIGCQFVLYKYGPFSFDLRDELTAMRADGVVQLCLQPPPYGPSLRTTELAKRIQGQCPKTLDKYGEKIAFAADRLGNKGVSELERLATALYVTREAEHGASVDDRAARIRQVKPHVPIDQARESVEWLDKIAEEADQAV